VNTETDGYIKHAERFGVDCVYDTAERELGAMELVKLVKALREIEAAKAYPAERRPVRWALNRVQKLSLLQRLFDLDVRDNYIAAWVDLPPAAVKKARLADEA
jgi:hypothetical protein